jgi:GWxTD domain-containing protein
MKKPIISFIVLLSVCTLGYAQGEFRFACKSERPKTEKDYRTWIKADVAYLITEAEREAFSALKTDIERNRFFAEFWMGREDIRAEYCKRVSYVNDHFLTGIPGWKTDRGHVYIINGKPDKIEKGRGNFGDLKSVLFEEWTYDHRENACGLGGTQPLTIKFIDPRETGDFRIYEINGTTDIARKDIGPMKMCM